MSRKTVGTYNTLIPWVITEKKTTGNKIRAA